MICLTSVVLPAPIGPSRVSISPRSIENVISRLAQVPSAYRLLTPSTVSAFFNPGRLSAMNVPKGGYPEEFVGMPNSDSRAVNAGKSFSATSCITSNCFCSRNSRSSKNS